MKDKLRNFSIPDRDYYSYALSGNSPARLGTYYHGLRGWLYFLLAKIAIAASGGSGREWLTCSQKHLTLCHKDRVSAEWISNQ